MGESRWLDRSTSRRSFLRTAALGGVAASVGVPALVACTTTRSGQSASTAKAKLPTYIQYKGVKPDLPGTAAGVWDGYLSYPKNLPRTVDHTPGSGGDVTALVIQYFPPPVAMDQNAYWQELNKQLGVTFRPNITGEGDYQAKMTAIVAGGDLPDMMLIPNSTSIPHLADFAVAKCANLDEHLAGDAVKDYPNLANIPANAWKTAAYRGSIYGLPLPRGVLGTGMFAQQNLFDQAGLSQPGNADDFARVLKDVTQPKRGVWGVGGTTTNTYSIDFFRMIFGAPNEWQQKGGKFTHVIESAAGKEAVNYMRGLFQAGVYHPDAGTMTTSQAKAGFVAGKFAAYSDGFNAFQQHWQTIAPVNPDFKVRVLIPFSHSGGRGTYFFGEGSFGTTVLKKASTSRIKELLRVANFLAAPFGSREYQLVTSGVKGIDFTVDDKGNPIPTDRGRAETTISSGTVGTYVVNPPQTIYDPKYPEFVRVVHQMQEQLVPLGIPNARVGLYSDAQTEKRASLTILLNDRLKAIISGRAPMSDYDVLVQDWKTQGGDQIRSELQSAFQRTGGA
jgi:putative aldouronate transport system substrate-binding protein